MDTAAVEHSLHCLRIYVSRIHVPLYYYICVLILLYVSSYYYYICVLILLYVSSYYYMCPHTTTYVSSY